MVRAVIFDVFGTLMEIRSRQYPYRQLLREGAEQGRPPSINDLRALMTFEGGLVDAANLFRIRLTPCKLGKLRGALEQELESIRLYNDAQPAIDQLRRQGVKLALCSNLAQPYCATVRRLIPDLDAYALSAELKMMKPDPQMYQTTCQMMNVVPGKIDGDHCHHVLMIGDSPKCDQHGPREIGVLGYHLARSGSGGFRNLLEFVSAIERLR